MNKVLKLQRVGLMTPTVVEYGGKVLATNQMDIESTCNLWRCHFGFYPTEKIDLAMTKKEFSVIQQKTLSSVKSVYDLFYEQNFIPRVFESKEEVSEWGMYRTNEVEKLKAENAELKSSLTRANEECLKWHERTQNLLKDSGGSISGYEKKISALQSENADLRERLEKAVELPVSLETPILKVWKNRVPEDDTRMSFVDMWEITVVNFKLEHYPLWGKLYFPNTKEGKEAAEAHLAELKGGAE